MAKETDPEGGAKLVRLARWPHPVLLILSLLGVVAVGAGGLGAGYMLRSSTEQRIQTASLPVEVTAEVRYQVRELDPVTGTVSTAAGYQYVPTAESFSGPIVVTNSGAGVGMPLAPGSLIASINDRPLFGLTLQVNLWRDLKSGDTGTDVLAINSALSGLGYLKGKPNSSYAANTTAAVSAMYKKAGLLAESAPPESAPTSSDTASSEFSAPAAVPPVHPGPPGSFLSKSSIANIPTPALVVSEVASVGSLIAAGTPVLTATGANNQLTTKIDILHQQQVQVGSAVELQEITGLSLGPATITAVGPFSAGDATKGGYDALNGYPMTVSFESSAATTTITSGDQVKISFPALSKRELAVPTIAIRQATGKSQVMLKTNQDYRLVDVTPLWQQDGWTGIDGATAAKVGDAVVVSGK